jgi:hypothetical protein
MRYLRRVDPSTRRDLPEWFRGGSLSPPWFPIRFFAVESGGAVKVLRQSPAECLLGLTEWTLAGEAEHSNGEKVTMLVTPSTERGSRPLTADPDHDVDVTPCCPSWSFN